jgi:hypothetical protein
MSREEYFRTWANEVRRLLRITPPWTPEMFVRAMAGYLEREVEVIDHDLEGSTIYGCCVALPGKFLIAVRHDASLEQRERTIYHEATHILRKDISFEGQMQACRELDATEPRERDAEDGARALASLAHSDLPKKHHVPADDSGLETFWDEMGSDD